MTQNLYINNFTSISEYSQLHKRDPLVVGFSSDEFYFYCPRCAAERRLNVSTLVGKRSIPIVPSSSANHQPIQKDFNVNIDCICGQCKYKAVVFGIVRELRVVFWSLFYLEGGVFASPNSPDAVKFYLDQAHKSHSMGANSAAVAMFRAALEHILFDIGYKDGMLGNKITQLERDIQAGKADPNAQKIQPEILRVLNNTDSEKSVILCLSDTLNSSTKPMTSGSSTSAVPVL